MKIRLNSTQAGVLRRCRGGLRVWEIGAERAALWAELADLCRLGLVRFDETSGYETTPAGDAWLAESGL